MTGNDRLLPNVKAVKACQTGELVSFRARALRLWETGGLRMCLAGDESALTRVEVGGADVRPGRSYEFRDALVREYPGGWHSASITPQGSAVPLTEDVPISQTEEYIEYTYKILTGVQRKKARREGRLPPWQHPAKGADD
ncbi:MAG: hypothetical protein Q7T33_12455 [Dehalococcoidia bacterium]|nr:hypothetical protein [Dehalococcoidia bacterium]